MEDSSTVVRLYPSQRAYRQDPNGFLMRLSARAATLFESGYRVYPAGEPHTFVIVCDGGTDPPQYTIHATEQTCSCPFHAQQAAGEYLGEDTAIIPCKHVMGLSSLVRKTRRWLYQTGQVRAFCALSIHWMKHLSALRRARIQEVENQEVGSVVVVTRYRCAAPYALATPSQGHRSCGTGWHASRKENRTWRQ